MVQTALETVRSAQGDILNAHDECEKMYHLAGLIDPGDFTADDVRALKSAIMGYGQQMVLGTRKILAVVDATIEAEIEAAK